MARKTGKPWFRAFTQRWYIQLDGVRIDLGPDEEQANVRYHQLMVDRAQDQKIRQHPEQQPVITILDLFLEYAKTRKAPRTFHFYQIRIQSFVRHLKATKQLSIVVKDLKPFHVQEWADSHTNWRDGTKHGFIQAVQRAFNWAEKSGHIDRSPIRHAEKPPKGKRTDIVSLAEFQEVLTRIRNDCFRDLVLFSWHTGVRPQESIIIEASFVDLHQRRAVIPTELAKGKKAPRIVYLPDEALEIVKRLVARFPEGPILRNTDGNPWTAYSVNCSFGRLQIAAGKERMKQLGIEPSEADILAIQAKLKSELSERNSIRLKRPAELREEAKRKATYKLARKYGKRYCVYQLRHTWATRALRNGVDALTVGILMGHRDASTLTKVYQHLCQSPEYLHDAMTKASETRKPLP